MDAMDVPTLFERCNFGFRQILYLPSSGRMCSGWAILGALYRTDSRWRVGFDGDNC